MATSTELRTDQGNADMFARIYKDKILYDHQMKSWWIFDRTRWRQDVDGEIYRMAIAVLRQRYANAGQIKDADERKRESEHAFRSENRVDTMVKRMSTTKGLASDGSQWDLNPWLLGVKNGVLDLQKGQLVKSEPSMFITKQAHVAFDPSASCPTWTQALDSYWPKDRAMVDFIQRAVGYSLTGKTTEQCLFFLVGKGSNGKNTFLDVLEEMLGDYADVVPFSAFELQSRSQISNDVAAMRGKRFLVASEIQEGMALNEGRIKSLTGDRKARARKLYEESVSFLQTFKIWWAANEKPPIRDGSDGLWRRLMMIQMIQQFKSSQIVRGLDSRLIEQELPGILLWAAGGCLEWQEKGLQPTDSILGEVDRYRAETNPLQEFYEECLEIKPGSGAVTPKSEIYAVYAEYCKRSGEKHPLTRQQVSRRLVSMGVQEKKLRVGTIPTWCWFEAVPSSVVLSWNGLNFTVSVP